MTIENLLTSSSGFQFSDSRQKRIYKRLQLIGPGPASFYYDTCRLMSIQPPLMSTTHIVSHLLREIESALRFVLLSASGTTLNPKSNSKHREGIEAILNFLEISPSSDVSKIWLELPDDEYGLHARAHRQALTYRPSDVNFLVFWENMQIVLDGILQQFEEKYLSAHQLVDQLLVVTAPTATDIEKLRQKVPNSPTALGVFFKNANVVWLELLKPHFFKLPPGADPVEDTFAPWPESQFLVRAAKSNPQSVLEIVLELPATNNPYVLDDLCDVALELPIEMAIQLVPKMKRWLSSQYQRLAPQKVAQFIKKLTESKKISEALELSQELLAIPLDSEKISDDFYTIRSRYQSFLYIDLLETVLPIGEIAPRELVRVLCKLLNDGIESLRKTSMSSSEDPSLWWSIFPQRYRTRDVEEAIIYGIYTTSVRGINANKGVLREIIEILESYSATIFRRIAVYLIAIRSEPSSDLVSKHLLNPETLDLFPREYYLLLQKGFVQLAPNEQATVLELLDAASESKESDHTLLRWLSAIKDMLPTNWQTRYNQLVEALGEPNPFVYASTGLTTAWTGDGSPKTSTDLLDMDIKDIVDYLNTWQQSDEFMARETMRGLGNQLKNAVALSPEKFATIADRLTLISPIYSNSFFSGLRKASSNGIKFDWLPVLTACLNIDDAVLSTAPSDESNWTWDEIANLLQEGFERDAIPYTHRDLVWTNITKLVTIANEANKQFEDIPHNMYPWDLLYNSLLGKVFQALMQYVFWVRRHIRDQTQTEEIEIFESTLALVPEARVLLERHLANKSLAVKAVFGQYAPWLNLIDAKWLRDNLEHIFVEDEQLWNVAWGAYITTWRRYGENFEVFKNQYIKAVSRINVLNLHIHSEYLEKLVSHLISFYASGLIGLEEPDDLLSLFYREASNEICAYAMQNVGQGLESAAIPIPDHVYQRFTKLWEYRLDVARQTPQAHLQEISAFSWWFVSAKLDAQWSLDQLKEVFRITADAEVILAEDVIAQLVQLAEQHPKDVIECLSFIIDRAREKWQIHVWQENMRQLLDIVLNSDHIEARQVAIALINRLAARGHLAFKDLLDGR